MGNPKIQLIACIYQNIFFIEVFADEIDESIDCSLKFLVQWQKP